MKHLECPGTLLARTRTQPVTDAERAALESHLENCECCRRTSVLMRDFDEASRSDRQDGARIERMAALARRRWQDRQAARERATGPDRQAELDRQSAFQLQQLGSSAPHPGGDAAARDLTGFAPRAWGSAPTHRAASTHRAARGLLLAAAVFLVVAGASGAILVQNAIRSGDDGRARPVLHAEVGLVVAEGARTLLGSRFRPATPAEVNAELALLQPSAGDAPASSAHTGCASGACGSDATTLFKEGNQARRDGRTTKAMGLYRELQRLHPRSREAQLSHLSLGHLLLAAGQSSAALGQFNLALRSAGASGVQAEALYGKGLALARLGRGSEERGAWQTLLRDFPGSPYAAHAQRRLAAND